MVAQELRKVEKAAAKAASSRLALESAIQEAHGAGQPLREIAKAARVSHEQIRRVVSADS